MMVKVYFRFFPMALIIMDARIIFGLEKRKMRRRFAGALYN